MEKMANSDSLRDDLFSSVIMDIKTYTGKDPLLPWLRGIRKIKESLPSQLLKQKLPRFLQKCTQTFETDRRYTNDLRYLRVWLQLMDFVDDPKAVLRTMELNRIGMKKSLFYQAYALYYEKVKKFGEAEKVYRLGVQNLAEPADELQKSFDRFLHRMECHRRKRIQYHEGTKQTVEAGSNHFKPNDVRLKNNNICRVGCLPTGSRYMEFLPNALPTYGNSENTLAQSFENESPTNGSNSIGDAASLGNRLVGRDPSVDFGLKRNGKQPDTTQLISDGPRKNCSDDTVVVKFVDTAIDGKSEVENAFHHGLVEPTINTKDALNAVNSMFREPLEPALVDRRSHRSQHKADPSLKIGDIFIEEKTQKSSPQPQHNRSTSKQPLQKPLQIYVDDEEENEIYKKNTLELTEVQNLAEDAINCCESVNAFVFPCPRDEDIGAERPPRSRLGEDTVVRRFVGSTIVDEPHVENVCHHGLIEPTVNLKEAMDDINGMFGLPIEFARKNRPNKQKKASDVKRDCGAFLILPDDETVDHPGDLKDAMDDINGMFGKPIEFAKKNRPNRQIEASDVKRDCGAFLILPDDDITDYPQGLSRPSSSASNQSDLFEPTLCTKEAMDNINKMFGMPLDF